MIDTGRTLLLAALLSAAPALAPAADWTHYRGDAGRTGYTPEQPPHELGLRWTYKPAHPPEPAWPTDAWVAFDRAYHVVADAQRVYFGSSADNQIRALDAASGREVWAFHTEGPVRFAPVLWRDRVFTVSDDGCLYCLSAAEGKLLWRKRGGPSERRILGNGRMISKWPARGGPVVVDDLVYFGAGIWPSEGIYVRALKAETGEEVWTDEKSGSITMPQPHSGARAVSGISCQGYLAAAGPRLFVPTGRASPAIFNRADGRLLHFSFGNHWGGSSASAFDSLLITSGRVFDMSRSVDTTDKACLGGLGAYQSLLAVTPELVVTVGYQNIVAADRAKPAAEAGGGKSHKWNSKWSLRWDHKVVTEMIAAGKTLFVAGPKDVSAIDCEAHRKSWSAPVEGTPAGLAFAAGRLYVSTEDGGIRCFAAGSGAPQTVDAGRTSTGDPGDTAFAAAAEEIVKKTGVTEGYCLDLGCGDGRLMVELARRTTLHIYGVESEAAKVESARKRLAAAGLCGQRCTVLQGDPEGAGLPNYFADLVVSARSLAAALPAAQEKEARRCQRPCGGYVCLGKAGAMVATRRGPLPGAGDWTHQYADAANTVCSGDDLVKGPLTVLWFGSEPQTVADRHGRSPAPLFADGRLYVEGLDDVRAYDAYNGRLRWKFAAEGITKPYDQEHLVGVAATGSNFCLWKNVLFVHTGDKCLRLDAASGRKLGEFATPAGEDGKPGTWGYLACVDGVLFGSLADTGHIVRHTYIKADMKRLFSESRELFAMDAESGEVKWRHRAAHSIRHNAVAVGGGAVYLIDRPKAQMDRLDFTPVKGEKLPEHPAGTLLALDAATGRQKWKVAENVYGTVLALSVKHDALLMSGQATRYAELSEKGGRFTVFRASTGKLIHDTRESSFTGRPAIIDSTVYGGTCGLDLLTGKRREGWRCSRSHHCGVLTGGLHLLAFRSATLGYCNLAGEDAGLRNFGGTRPGCWINAIPAGGLLLVPDYTHHCACSYQIKSSLALEPAR